MPQKAYLFLCKAFPYIKFSKIIYSWWYEFGPIKSNLAVIETESRHSWLCMFCFSTCLIFRCCKILETNSKSNGSGRYQHGTINHGLATAF